jgi:hypothetical protein
MGATELDYKTIYSVLTTDLIGVSYCGSYRICFTVLPHDAAETIQLVVQPCICRNTD